MPCSYTTPTRQRKYEHELDNTDHTKHTDIQIIKTEHILHIIQIMRRIQIIQIKQIVQISNVPAPTDPDRENGDGYIQSAARVKGFNKIRTDPPLSLQKYIPEKT